MAMNPMAMMKLKERLELFGKDHPKVVPFFEMLNREGLKEGSIYEMKVTDPDGKEHVMKMRLNTHDIETIRMLMENKKKK